MDRLQIEKLTPEELERSHPVLSVAGTLAFPGFVVAVPLSRSEDMELVRRLENGDVVVQLMEFNGRKAAAAPAGPAPEVEGNGSAGTIGVAARVVTGLTSGDTVQVVLEGVERVRVMSIEGHGPESRATVKPYVCPPEPAGDLDPAADQVVQKFKQLVRTDRQISPELGRLAERRRNDPSLLADFIASSLPFSAADRQAVIEAPCISARLITVSGLLDQKLDSLHLELQIQDRARARVEAEQKEKLLREQLKEIREALGESTDADLVTSFRSRLIGSAVPVHVKTAIETELHRLENLSPASVEYDTTRHHIETLLSLPWGNRAPTTIDLQAFERHLNDELVGLARAKNEILEFVSVLKLNPDLPGPALAIIGPPGVGRNVMARTIAAGLGRPFVRIDLESIEMPEELTGVRQTALGAEPGLIIRALISSGVMNPVLLLEGLDSLRDESTPRLIRAILSVLSPERRPDFEDDFLRVTIDLGGMLVVATAMTPFSIPEPFVDALSFVTVSSYIDAEKIEIARQHLIPEQMATHGLKNREVRWSDDALLFIIRRYTREPGIWQLNRTLATICRKLAREAALEHPLPDLVGENDVVRLLGRPRIPRPGTGRSDEVGVALGLAWTADGGDILPVEAIRLPGNGEVQLTGQLGEVMRESAAAAVSYVRSRFEELRIPPEAFLHSSLHINLPEGAIPKDGPSAGITLAVVIASLMTNRPVRHDVAMTGEITLRGRILPVGGLREKILGAHRAGIRTVILPAENTPDLEDVPDPILKEMRFVPVETADQALEEALVRLPAVAAVMPPYAGPPPVIEPMPVRSGVRSRHRPAASEKPPRVRRAPPSPERSRRSPSERPKARKRK